MLRWPYWIAVTLTLPSCGDSGSGPEGDIAGRYELVAVDGRALPAVITSGTNTATHHSGHIDLRSDRSVSLALSFTLSGPGLPGTMIEATDSGTWSANGSLVRVLLAERGEWTGAVTGDALAFAFATGQSIRFRR
jgi:hypothetical protein